MIKQLILLATFFCSPSWAMDSNSTSSAAEPKKKIAKTQSTLMPLPEALPWPLTREAASQALNQGKPPSTWIHTWNLTHHVVLSDGWEKETATVTTVTHRLFQLIKMRAPIEVIKAALAEGADNNATNGDFNSPLHVAVEVDYPEGCIFLIESGSNINGGDAFGRTPLANAIIRRNPDLCALLIQRGADVNAPDNWGAPPLYYSIRNPDVNLLTLLVDNGANVHARFYRDRSTPLHQAAVDGEADACTLLLQRGALINAVDFNGRTPLHWSAESTNPPLFALLIENGATVTQRDRFGNTALHYALCQNEENTDIPTEIMRVVVLCIEHGADVKALNHAGDTPLHWAVRDYQYDADDSAKEIAKIVELLIENGAIVTATNKEGITPLHEAAATHELFCRILIQRGANIHVRDRHGRTPLHHAAVQAQLNTCKLLLGLGADANVLCNGSKTALYLLIERILLTPRTLHNLSTYEQTIRAVLENKGAACVIPRPSEDREIRKSRILTALSVLKCQSLPIRIPSDVSHLILASISELREDLLCLLLPLIQKHADNNTLRFALKKVPVQYHGFIIGAIHSHTMNTVKAALRKLDSKEEDFIHEQFGKMMYHGIAQQLGAEIIRAPEPEHLLFAA